MIVQLRGTSGSGKSTAMTRIMEMMGGWQGVTVPGRKKPQLYHCVEAGWDKMKVTVLGHYESPCGGCDTVGSAAAVYDLIREVRDGNGGVPILCEGLLLSEDTKWALKLKEDGEDVRCLFLTTPLAKCLEQIKGRREAAGNTKPLNEGNTTNRVAVIERARRKLLEAGMSAHRCSADQAPGIVLNWLRLHAQQGA